jgi:hypothetical protein
MTNRTRVEDKIGVNDATDDDYAAWRVVVRSLHRIDPYLDVEEIDRFEPIQDEAEWGVADFLHLMDAVTAESGVVVDEMDYPKVASLAGLEDYISSRMTRISKAS